MNDDQNPEHLRHKPFTQLERPRELVIACPAFKSSVNLSRVVRLAGCAAVEKVIACGSAKIDPTIARDGGEHVLVERRRTLTPVLRNLRTDGYRLVGLERAHRLYWGLISVAKNLYHYSQQKSTRKGRVEGRLSRISGCALPGTYSGRLDSTRW
jgi:hypothetical protein